MEDHAGVCGYLKAVEYVPDIGEKRYADKLFFSDVPSCFFSTYLVFFTDTFQLL